MGSAFLAIRQFLGRGRRQRTREQLARLREEYRVRCRSFRLLVKANHEALAALADLEELRRAGRPFGMARIRALSVRGLMAGFQMVRQLNRMAPGTYEELFTSLASVQTSVDAVLRRPAAESCPDNVLPLDRLTRQCSRETGGKLARLGEARQRMGIHIPEGFVITASACRRFLDHNDLPQEIDRLLQTTENSSMAGLYELSSTLRSMILRAEVPSGLRVDMQDQLTRMQALSPDPLRLAVRSSALGEDVAGASFAGQFHTELNVPSEHVEDAFKAVVASKYGPAALAYRFHRGIRDSDVDMSVGCMEMVSARVGGVLYTRDPLHPEQDCLHISAVFGLPQAIVDGSAVCDRFVVSRCGRRIVERHVAHKEWRTVCHPGEGTVLEEAVASEQDVPCLTDGQIVALVGMGLRLEEIFGAAQDVEWIIREDGAIVLLQCRDLHFPALPEESDAAEPAPEELERHPLREPLLRGGVTASAGAAAGVAVAVRSDADALRFPEQAVLVARSARPRWAPLLSRAAAVITEHGASAGHLASVAREYGVPALFSLPGALDGLAEQLDRGAVITVDADRGAVYAGKVEPLLRRPPVRGLMFGSPVHHCLEGVLEHLAPLNLDNPDARSFAPENCRTLHDVLRYCHEMGVREMFCMEPRSGLEKGVSRRLVDGVPLQYWVVDLEDGLEAPEDSDLRTVDIADVRCRPMLALWEGMQAVVWRGPPAVNAGGLVSVMVRSVSDPGLAEGAASPYAVRNYFLISREYCSLQSRFGYHFCTVEAVLGQDPEENYVIFQFKGGAADWERRIRRARLVGDVLEDYGFLVELKEDALYARQEGADARTMDALLRVVGYLVVHTRQLDMIMGDSAEVARVDEQIRTDLAEIGARAAGIPPPAGDGTSRRIKGD